MLGPICVDILCKLEIYLASNPRELAYKVLLAAEKDSSQRTDELLSKHLQHSDLSEQERRWTMELVYGSTRMKLQLDTLISSAFKGRYHKAQHAIKILLRIGAFQLKHMQTSEHAAIHETVALSRKVKQGRASGLINAVLRKLQKTELGDVLKDLPDEIQQLAVERSHPAWLIEKWLDRYTPDQVSALCDHNNSVPLTWVRRNATLVGVEEFEAFLKVLDIKFHRSEVLDTFYKVESAAPLFTTNEFHRGWFSFQDLAAGIVATLLIPAADDIIVDACAAPGGKMAFLSELSGGQAQIFACDASAGRLVRVQENIDRLQLKGIEVLTLDASSGTLPTANKILLDVPCSGTGVLNRRPDARWRRQPSDIESLTSIQAQILVNSWKYLQPGGLLVYATCTLETEENWGLIDSVLEQLDNAGVEVIDDDFLKPYIDERGALSTLPWRDEMDGMFAVKIRKSL